MHFLNRGLPDPASARRILVIKLGALGDIIQAEGALHDVRVHHPDAHITVLTNPRYKPIFERCPWVDAVMTDPRGSRLRIDLLLKLRRDMRSGGFDAVYDLQGNRRTGLYYYWLSVPWVGSVAGKPFPQKPCDAAVDTLYELLRSAGLEARHTRRPDLGWLADDVDQILAAAGARTGFVLLIPGCSARHPEKRWPHYAQLAARLIAEGTQVVMAPGPDEIDLCKTIPGIALFDGGKPLSVFQLVGLSRRAGFVIGNDTGPSHIAAHTGAKGLALFGSGVHASATYIDRRFAVIEVADLGQLTVDRVYEAYKAELAHAAR